MGPATTEGKRKVRPVRRDVDAYGQPILLAPGSTQEEAEKVQDDRRQAEAVGEEHVDVEVSLLKYFEVNFCVHNFLDDF